MKQIFFSTFVLLTFSVVFAMNFKPPDSAERLRAIGPTEGLAETLRKALDAVAGFEPVGIPKPGDWLAEHYEPGQTFEEFIKSNIKKPDQKHCKIYLQPLGQFPKEPNDLLSNLQHYASAFFCVEVTALAPINLDNMNFTARTNPHTGNRQLLTTDILSFLKKICPSDAFCILAITMEDLYPEPSWNFVFGQASLSNRVGVYSFARYDPLFYGEKRGKDYEKVLLQRSCKVLAHEISHMFGITHCIYFKCILNGSNHLLESDSRPMHLCPVCLRKLQYSIEFDVISRYVNLFRFYKEIGLDDDAKWVEDRLKWILPVETAKQLLNSKTSQKK